LINNKGCQEKWLQDQDEKQLTAGIAHEIKNPLAAMHGFLQLLAQRVKDDSTSTYYVQTVVSELNRLQELVEDYLYFGRIKYTSFIVCNLGEIVDRVVGLIRDEVHKRNIRINVKKQAACPNIKASPKLMHQLMWNLINNAVAALPDGGDITLDIKQSDCNWLRLSCRDTGTGIPSAILPQIFTPYFTTKENGTGLGLVISRLIVHAHGGQLEVDSNVGFGTTFTIWLPITQDIKER
jgi:signal transduction histidine kinase